MSALHWLHPGWLLLALLPLPLLFWPPAADRRYGRLEQFIQRHLWARVLSAPLRAGRRGRPGFMSAWLLLSLALAGPYLVEKNPQEIEKLAANIAVVMDISPSMGAQDIQPSRLARAQTMVTDFSQGLDHHRLALIAFSANAYTVLPLTEDTGAFRHFLNELDPSLAYVTGSNLGRGLRLARQALDNAPGTGGLVLLVSDGEIHDPAALAAATDLRQAGHTLIALGVGTVQGAPVPLAGGRLVRRQGAILTSHLQRDTLRRLAAAGGGDYFDLQAAIWPQLEAEINRLQQALFKAEIDTRIGQPLFPLLILAALLILFWQTVSRPQGLATLLLGLTLIPAAPVEAAPWTEARGLQQLHSGANRGALETYSELNNYAGLMGQGAAAYRLGQWQAALQAFERAYGRADSDEARARAAYNQGRALSQLHQLDRAVAAFERALELRGSYPRASHNLLLLERARQQWGARQQSEAEQARPGPGQTETDSGAGGMATGTPLSGESEHAAQLSTSEGNQRGAREKTDAALRESLARWSQRPDTERQAPRQAWQQYRNLQEDSQTLLKRRFEIEDKRALGTVEEKPW